MIDQRLSSTRTTKTRHQRFLKLLPTGASPQKITATIRTTTNVLLLLFCTLVVLRTVIVEGATTASSSNCVVNRKTSLLSSSSSSSISHFFIPRQAASSSSSFLRFTSRSLVKKTNDSLTLSLLSTIRGGESIIWNAIDTNTRKASNSNNNNNNNNNRDTSKGRHKIEHKDKEEVNIGNTIKNTTIMLNDSSSAIGMNHRAVRFHPRYSHVEDDVDEEKTKILYEESMFNNNNNSSNNNNNLSPSSTCISFLDIPSGGCEIKKEDRENGTGSYSNRQSAVVKEEGREVHDNSNFGMIDSDNDDDNDNKYNDEASITTALTTTSTKLAIVGGGQQDQEKDNDDNNSKSKGSFLTSATNITPEGKSVLCMASAMAIHYLAYSFARPSTIALFTSKTIGFKSPSAFPLAMAFISPTSLGLLLVYGKLLDAKGPRMALKQTTLLCSGTLIGFAILIELLQQQNYSNLTLLGGKIRPIQLLVGTLFIFRESYIQLITSQYWSFMSSVLTPTQSATWFAPISGLTSILSAIAGLCVSTLIQKVGLPGVVASAGMCLGCSLFFSERAYDIAEKNGFNPEEEQRRKREEKEAKKKKLSHNNKDEEDGEDNLFHKATILFQRVPTLGRLFVEILSSQGLSTLLNVCFVTKLSDAIPNDGDRAGWTGKFFATINIISCILQFGILPNLMKIVEPSWVWRVLPMIMLCLTTIQGLEAYPSLYLVAGSLMTMKILEFSARRMLDEMIYVPLDYESRFVGKEVIGVFGYRFGKSGTSLLLSGITSIFGQQLTIQQLSQLTIVAAFNWFIHAYRLSNLVPTKAQAQKSYETLHQSTLSSSSSKDIGSPNKRKNNRR